MTLVGVIGGIGPESTIDFYRLFVEVYQRRRPDGSYPPVVINCVDLSRMVALVSAGDMDKLEAFIVEELHRLARAGCTVGLLSANTPHLIFDRLRRVSPLPLLSIVETASRAAAEQRLTRVGLFGTRFTMQGGFFQEVFARDGIDVVVPDAADQEAIHTSYMGELVKGVFRTETRDRFVAIARRLRSEHGIEALILGGTELPLLLRDATDLDLPLLDTTRLLVERAVEEMLA
jgi:aspartate racemase